MLFTYDKSSNNITQLSETNFRAHKIMERKDIETWVEKHPELLGENLLILTTEYDKFDKTDERLDLLALDKDGNLVVIELKRDDSGRCVDLQAIKYASYISTLTLQDTSQIYADFQRKFKPSFTIEDAREEIINFIENEEFEEINDKPRIIIVSRDFRPEVTSTVLWLRKYGINIKCVKLTPYELGINSIALESSIIIPLPEAEDYIIKSEQKEYSEGSITVTQQEYLNFYKDISSRFYKAYKVPTKEPKGISYLQIPTPFGSTHYEWCFHGRPRNSFGVEIHFEKSDREKNVQLMKMLLPYLKDFREKEHIQLEYVEDPQKKSCRIFVIKNQGAITDNLKFWSIDTMGKVYGFFQPILEKLSNDGNDF